MPPRRPLTAHSAQITTAAVEIKTLTVSGKQVTLAVFRQLYDEQLYDPITWEPAGVPWCRVNYHPDKCAARDRVHEHVVWQKGEELRRSRIDYSRDGLWDVPRFGYDDLAALCVKGGGQPNIQIDQEPVNALGKRHELHVSLDVDGEWIGAKLLIKDPHIAGLMTPYVGIAELEHGRLHRTPAACAEARKIIEQRARQCEDWLIKADQRWEEVQNLDQVFIAV